VEGDNPSEVPDSVLDDRAAWAQANPALGIRISPDTMAGERESLRHLPRTFAVELLGIGDWPNPDHVSSVLDWRAFAELEDEASTVEDPVCIAFDVSPDRYSSVAVAGRRADGLWHIEITASRRSTDWVPEYVAGLVKRHCPSGVVCDAYGPAASLLPALEELGVEVQTLTASEHGQACGRFVDAIAEGKLRFPPDPTLIAAARAAKTRPLGDAWAWSRKSSDANISPLVSVTLALSAAMTLPESMPVIVLPGVGS
jgi:phage terminase large subunit-like protein